MKIVELKARIAADGSIHLPSGTLERMGMTTGDMVHLAYLSHHHTKALNSFGEFFITKDGIDCVSEPEETPDTAALTVPHTLLEAAGIPLDDDLDITIAEGCIMIVRSKPPRRARGGTRGELVPAREAHRERSEPAFSAENVCAYGW